MCLIVFSYQQHPDYPLILIANRDERHSRRTQKARFWHDAPFILAGRDLEGMGTWLGIQKQGKLAAITNFREGIPEPSNLSRGILTTNFLTNQVTPRRYLSELEVTGSNYNGFNLLFGNISELYYFSNRAEQHALLTPGIYSLSNHLLNSPWPKAEHAKDQLETSLTAGTLDYDSLIMILQRRDPYPDELLPDTGVGLEMERTLSPPFIVAPDYGTRCTTLLLWHKSGVISFIEQNYLPDGTFSDRQVFNLTVQEESQA